MGKLLSILSAVVGSSPATLLNARAEVSNRYGQGVMSNSEEKKFVFERLAKDLPVMIGQEAKQWPPGAAIGFMLDTYTQTGRGDDIKFSQIFNRVMVHYYDYDLKSVDSLGQALTRMGLEFDLYLRETNRA